MSIAILLANCNLATNAIMVLNVFMDSAAYTTIPTACGVFFFGGGGVGGVCLLVVFLQFCLVVFKAELSLSIGISIPSAIMFQSSVN